MSFLFHETIDGWDDWSRVFCDTKAFTPLAKAIYQNAGLGNPGPLRNLTPGTNAVFRCGDTVIKLFAPEESGIQSESDFEVERTAHQSAAQNGVRVPRIIGHGMCRDRYLFQYLIMEYVNGVEAGSALASYTKDQKTVFARQVCTLLDKLHQPGSGSLPLIDIRARAINNPRLSLLPTPLAEDMRARAASAKWEHTAVVHGDLTGENVLIEPDGSLVLIDFADSVQAPVFYELAPLVFELFRCDGDMVDVLRGGMDIDIFLEQLLSSITLHDFGANIIIAHAERRGIPLESLLNLAMLKHFIM